MRLFCAVILMVGMALPARAQVSEGSAVPIATEDSSEANQANTPLLTEEGWLRQ